jgi:membrane protein DedA with SNARE-associated domain
MPVATYSRVSLLSVVVYVPAVFWVAYWFGEEIDAAVVSLKRLGDAAWGLFFVIISLWVVLRFWTSRLRMARRKRVAS